ncbi:MAG: hypothetical protein LUG93_18685 [Lachnospiraceae bacterium]|nr:hypothetical protein [Lachnospiraceae bacterium]
MNTSGNALAGKLVREALRKYGFAFRGKEVLISKAEDEQMSAEEFNAAAVAYSKEYPFQSEGDAG